MNNPYISYCVSKKEGEEAIWAFVASAKPSFTVTVLLPALIFGPPIQPITGMKRMNYSTDVLYSLLNGSFEKVPPTSFGSFVSYFQRPHHHDDDDDDDDDDEISIFQPTHSIPSQTQTPS
jgi:nucleoside-diphosphate-sugar epimerase